MVPPQISKSQLNPSMDKLCNLKYINKSLS